MMKKLLRLIIKILVTPIAVPVLLFLVITGYISIFIDWLYDKSEWDKSITKDIHNDFLKLFKNWFTTI